MLLTQAQFARKKGVNRSTVSRWIERKRLTLTDAGLVDVDAAEKSLARTASPYAHHEARAEQTGSAALVAAPATPHNAPATSPQQPSLLDNDAGEGAGGSAADDASLRLKLARARREQADAESAEIELAKKSKLLVARADVEFVMDDFGRTTGNLLDRLADRYVPTIAAAGGDPTKIHAALSEAARDIRRELAAYLTRRAGELL